MADETKPLNLVQKLAKIRMEIDHIEKKGTNPHFGYKYMKAEDVAGDIGDKLAAANIVLGIEDGRCEVHESGKGWFVVTQSNYIFKDGDTGETHKVWSCGAGSDSSDKGLYKALTGALKYALTQALCMRVGDDAEADTDTERKTPQNGSNREPRASTDGQVPLKTARGTFRVPLRRPDSGLQATTEQKQLLIDTVNRTGQGTWFAKRLRELGLEVNSLLMTEYEMLAYEVSSKGTPPSRTTDESQEDDIGF